MTTLTRNDQESPLSSRIVTLRKVVILVILDVRAPHQAVLDVRAPHQVVLDVRVHKVVILDVRVHKVVILEVRGAPGCPGRPWCTRLSWTSGEQKWSFWTSGKQKWSFWTSVMHQAGCPGRPWCTRQAVLDVPVLPCPSIPCCTALYCPALVYPPVHPRVAPSTRTTRVHGEVAPRVVLALLPL